MSFITRLLFALMLGLTSFEANAINAGGPIIYSGSPISATARQTIKIVGTNFGTKSPYTGNSNYIHIFNLTKQWGAGYQSPNSSGGDLVTLTISSWTNTQIIVSEFSGYYGSGNWTLNNGDVILVFVGNPQSGIVAGIFDSAVNRAPSVCVAVVGSGLPCVM